MASLQADLWRRQTFFDAGVRDVVNCWPVHARSPTAMCWLKDDVAPHIDSFPLPGRPQHAQGILAVPLRAAKAIATTTLTVKYSRDLKLIADANRILYRALEVLVRGAPEPPPRDLLDDLNAVMKGEGLPRRTEFGFLEQVRYLRQAAVALGALLLPGEGVLDTVYRDWRTLSEATRPQAKPGTVQLKLSIVAIGDAAADQGTALRTSLECQPGQWEYFVQASAPSDTSALPLRTLATIRRGVSGDWVAIASESLSLAPFAVEDLLRTAESSKAAIVYADHDEFRRGTYAQPFFKPGWSPDLFLEVNYLGGLVCVRRDVFDAWAKRFEEITSSDVSRLVLDCHHQREEIARAPGVLWHRLKPVDESHHRRAVTAYLKEHRPGAELQTVDGVPRVTYPREGHPKVSIVVPFRDRPDLLERLVLSLQRNERWSNYELLLVSNASSNPATARFLASVVDQRVGRLEWNHPYNFQALCNHAAKAATGDYLLFASSGLEWPQAGALEVMLGHCQRAEIGAVGASLYSGEGRIQHAGITVGLGGFAASPFQGTRVNPSWTAFGLPQWTRNFSAVTAECMMIRRALFEEIDGFDTRFYAKNGDVDLCLRLRARGLFIVNAPQVSMMYTSPQDGHDEVQLEGDAWNAYPRIAEHLRDGDPYYNPNLSIASVDCLPSLDTRSAEDLARQTLAIMLPGSLELVPMGERP